MSENKTFQSCFVPLCGSTNVKTPNKIFFCVPKDEKMRLKWFQFARRKDVPKDKYTYYCCDDHFNIKDDMDNYIRYCLMGGPKKLKKDAIPHKFACQPNRCKINEESRPAFIKLNRKREIQDILSETENQENFTSKQNDQPASKNRKICDVIEKEALTNLTNIAELSKIESPLDVPLSNNLSSVTQDALQPGFFMEKENESSVNLLPTENCDQNSKKSVGTQVRKSFTNPHVRSKHTTCKPDTRDASCETKVEMVDKMCSPINFCGKESVKSTLLNSDSSAIVSSSNVTSEYKYTSISSEYKKSSTCSEEKNEKQKAMKKSILDITLYLISVDPKKYVGINQEWLWILPMLSSSTNCSVNNIKLTLQKIKTDDTFSRLGDQYGISTSQASRIFDKNVDRLAHYLKTLVYFPDEKSIKKNLPIAFRANYSNACAIIDAFEIEIEKPSNPVHQALTWSDYKKCNTMKYLIVCSPDGFITFTSKGYGGRISDTLLFEESKLINILPAGCGVLADRGFKHIQSVLNKRKCKLLRPPSVSTTSKSTKAEVLKTKSIASIRIHIERVIRRVREFEILKPHSCLDLNTVVKLDSIVTIVGGLINLQKPIIRK